MAVDVITEIVIDRPSAQVAAYAADPSHAPEWYANIDSVEWKTERPLKPRRRAGNAARFLGRRRSSEGDALRGPNPHFPACCRGRWPRSTPRLRACQRHPVSRRENAEVGLVGCPN